MAFAKPTKITSWSISRYHTYAPPTGCPAKAGFKFVKKIHEPGSEAMVRGSAIHAIAEAYIKGWKEFTYEGLDGKKKTLSMGRGVPAELKPFAAEFKRLRTKFAKGSKLLPMTLEDTWAFRDDWTQTTWNDWNGCWLRVKLDLGEFLDELTYVPTDFKTGSMRAEKREEYMEQLELYAVGALTLFGREGLVVRPRLLYLDHGTVYDGSDEATGAPAVEYTMADLPKLQKKWAKAVKPMLSDVKFAPRPGQACKWCFYSKAKHGDCKF